MKKLLLETANTIVNTLVLECHKQTVNMTYQEDEYELPPLSSDTIEINCTELGLAPGMAYNISFVIYEGESNTAFIKPYARCGEDYLRLSVIEVGYADTAVVKNLVKEVISDADFDLLDQCIDNFCTLYK